MRFQRWLWQTSNCSLQSFLFWQLWWLVRTKLPLQSSLLKLSAACLLVKTNSNLHMSSNPDFAIRFEANLVCPGWTSLDCHVFSYAIKRLTSFAKSQALLATNAHNKWLGVISTLIKKYGGPRYVKNCYVGFWCFLLFLYTACSDLLQLFSKGGMEIMAPKGASMWVQCRLKTLEMMS